MSRPVVDRIVTASGRGVEVTSLRAVVRDGWYNAFTDLALWKDYYWLAYRRGLGHGAGNSVEVVLRSKDLRRWHEVKAFESPYGIDGDCAVGDGHFCATDDRLYMTISTRFPSSMFSSWTSDGVDFSEPQLLQYGDVNPYAFRTRWRDGKFYSAVVPMEEGHEQLDLLVSDDHVNWSHHTQIAPRPGYGDAFTEETELHWLPDGELWCVVRINNGKAELFRSAPPYTQWEDPVELGVLAHAPAMCSCSGQVFLSGRCISPGGAHNTTGLYRLDRDAAELVLSFPTGYDSSYPGLASPEPGKLVMSFYSDAAYVSRGSATGDMPGMVPLKHFPEFVYKKSECDIYIAEIDVSE